ncbi:opioid-binding protein/cell adhesion molecule homolog isoform X2 [Megachile rotundata]|uniref:opioid-binding protein/cell adhesion molecule homolog isoform X2 n=1 Tax=Megachile rotundata TaxID=143995 RepID=UPI003FD0C6B6
MKDRRRRWLFAALPLITFFSHQIECAAKSGGISVEHHPSSYWEQPFSQPYFDNTTKRETTTTVGQSAYLHCRVRNLGDRAVSWIRKRDLHILTVGILTYTNDQRFVSLHSDGSDEWTLKISSPQVRDSGTYECQVSTEPKISQSFNLSVVVSKAKINGNSELYIKSGSDINLTCIVLQTPEPPSFIYWRASSGDATRELEQQRCSYEDSGVAPVASARRFVREVTGRSRILAIKPRANVVSPLHNRTEAEECLWMSKEKTKKIAKGNCVSISVDDLVAPIHTSSSILLSAK